MQIIITEKERRHFVEEYELELHDLIEERTLNKAFDEIDQWQSTRGIKEQWIEGHNLFTTLPSVKRLLTTRPLLSVIHQLTRTSPLRLTMSQLLMPLDNSLELPSFYHEEERFDHQVCFQGLKAAMILCLIPPSSPLMSPFPMTKGSIIFFPIGKKFSMNSLLQMKDGLFLLAAFGEQNVLYKRQNNDPHLNFLKNEGYAFGDRLKNEQYPLYFFT